LLRSEAEFESGTLPAPLAPAQEDMRWAEHWVFVFPLWHGTMPALFKGFLEQIFRPGFALEQRAGGFPKRLLAGRSARLVVTMGMPVWIYRWYFGAHGLKSLERSILGFCGIGPCRESLFGMVETASPAKRARWIAGMRKFGAAGH